MALEWFKVERATLHKPEVLLAADMLDKDRRYVLGLFLDWFSWIDEHVHPARPAVVPQMSRAMVEANMQCPGFAAVLEATRWGKFDDKACTLTLPNWDRHNGKSAKSRALEQRKKQLQRQNASRNRPGNVPFLSPENRDQRREEVLTTNKGFPKSERSARTNEDAQPRSRAPANGPALAAPRSESETQPATRPAYIPREELAVKFHELAQTLKRRPHAQATLQPPEAQAQAQSPAPDVRATQPSDATAPTPKLTHEQAAAIAHRIDGGARVAMMQSAGVVKKMPAIAPGSPRFDAPAPVNVPEPEGKKSPHKPANGAAEWFKSGPGIEAKARELGLTPINGETYKDLKARVFERMRNAG